MVPRKLRALGAGREGCSFFPTRGLILGSSAQGFLPAKKPQARRGGP